MSNCKPGVKWVLFSFCVVLSMLIRNEAIQKQKQDINVDEPNIKIEQYYQEISVLDLIDIPETPPVVELEPEPQETVVESVHKPATVAPTRSNTGRSKNITERERELMLRLVHSEARGEPIDGQIAVIEVVFNRVSDSRFPNSVEEVIFQRSQFCGVRQSSFNHDLSTISTEALDNYLNGERVLDNKGVVFFYNPKYSSSGIKGFKFFTEIGSHSFGTY